MISNDGIDTVAMACEACKEFVFPPVTNRSGGSAEDITSVEAETIRRKMPANDISPEERKKMNMNLLLNLFQVYIKFFLMQQPHIAALDELIINYLCRSGQVVSVPAGTILDDQHKLIVVLEGLVDWKTNKSQGTRQSVSETIHTYSKTDAVLSDLFAYYVAGDSVCFSELHEVVMPLKEVKADEETTENILQHYTYYFQTRTDCLLLVYIDTNVSSMLYDHVDFVKALLKERYVFTVEMFKNMSIEEKKRVGAASEIEEFDEMEQIISQGDLDGKFFVIIHGAVLFTRKVEIEGKMVEDKEKNPSGEEREIGKFFPGKGFGEGSCLLGMPRRASALAVKTEWMQTNQEKIILLSLTRENFKKYTSQKMQNDLTEKYRLRTLHGVMEEKPNYERINSERIKLNPSVLEPRLYLGKGAFSSVILVSHTVLGTNYALKCRGYKEISRLRGKESVIRESKLIYSLNHPFIIKIFEAFDSPMYFFTLFEVILGGRFTDFLNLYGRFPLDVALFYVAQIVLALEYLHRKQIVHRDVKPDNIMLTRDGYLKLTDFDTAKILTPNLQPRDRQKIRLENLDSKLRKERGVAFMVFEELMSEREENLRTFTFCGTPTFSAPEIFFCFGHGLKSDIWSLGLLLLQCLSGRKLFYTKTVQNTVSLVIKFCESFPSVQNCVPWLRKNDFMFNQKMYSENDFETTEDLLFSMLHPYPSRRFCISDVKKNQVFEDFPWDDLETKKLKPPLLPTVESLDDTRNFALAKLRDKEIFLEIKNISNELHDSKPVLLDS